MNDLPQVAIKTGKKFTFPEILQIITLVSVILYFGQTLFIPLSFAMLISFILYPLCRWLEKKGMNSLLAIIISMSGLLFLVSAIVFLLLLQVRDFLGEWQSLKGNLVNSFNDLSVFLSGSLNISLELQEKFFKNLTDGAAAEVIPFLKMTAWSFSVSFVLAILIPLFSFLILYSRKMLVNVIYNLFSPTMKETIHSVLIDTAHAYYNFIKGMLFVYLIVGTLNSIGLAIIGVPHPILFGFIASILTFIPYVGIIIASLLPITVSWITFNSIWYPLGVILVFSIVQLLEAYIIFPFAVSNRLKINTLMILLAILAGGILWGAAGMILFIPFISIAKLIADRTESLKTISMLLS